MTNRTSARHQVRIPVMRGLTAVLLVLAGTLMVAREAGATASTHIWAPSTDVQRFRVVHLTYDVYVPAAKTESGYRLPSVTNLGLTCGVLPFQKINLELGADHKTGYGTLDSYPMYFNAKLGLPENALYRISPALAVGILDAGTKKDATDYDVLYGKVAQTLGPIGRLSVGYFSGNDTLILDAGGEKDNAGVMAAWERTMPEISDRLWLCVDYMGTKSAYGTLSLGGSWGLAKGMSILAGYDIFNESKMSPNTATVQLDVDFGQ
jgi:hypothetical protein